MSEKKILVTGASGYIGSRLIPSLLSKGYHVRATGRSLDGLSRRIWSKHPRVELMVMDVLHPSDVERAVQGCDAVYYLIHSMNPQHKSFADVDRIAAENMVQAAEKANLEQIVYLGGLEDQNAQLSKHLQSRLEVDAVLHSGKVPVTTLRAAMIMGTGSVSFEILTYLVKRLPIMVTPRWVSTESQPIAVRNVIEYLVGCLERKETLGQTYDIGGPDIITYRELMRIFAEEAHFAKRVIIPVPVLTPKLSSYWIHLVTPIHSSLARPLAEGLRNRLVCQDHRICEIIPQDLIGAREAIRLSLGVDQKPSVHIEENHLEIPPVEVKYPGDPKWAGCVTLEKL